MAGVAVNTQSIDDFNTFKRGTYSFILYRISEDLKEVQNKFIYFPRKMKFYIFYIFINVPTYHSLSTLLIISLGYC